MQLQIVAQLCYWTEEETMIQLCLALEAKALQALMDLPVEQHGDFAVLTTALQQQFREEPAALSVRKLSEMMVHAPDFDRVLTNLELGISSHQVRKPPAAP